MRLNWPWWMPGRSPGGGSAAVVTHGRARQAAWVSEARVNAWGWPGWLTGEEQAAPGVGEEVLVAFGAPAPLAY